MCKLGTEWESLDDLHIDFDIDIKSNVGLTLVPCKEYTGTSSKTSGYKSWHFQIIKTDGDGDNLISTAIILGKTDIALMLINLIPDYKWLSRQNKMFQTALHIATLTNNYHVVRRLIVAGIDISKQDWKGNTALHIACLNGLTNIAKALLTPVKYIETKMNSYEIPYQAIPQNLEVRNSEGLTCFLIAILKRNRDIIELLIEHETDINSFELKSGKTCLHILAEYGDDVLIRHMLSQPRINVNTKTYSGYTALQIAICKGYDNIVYLLKCAGAEEAIFDDGICSD